MIRPGLESARQFAGKAAYSEQGGLTRHKTNRLGGTMIQSKLAAFALIAGPAQAGTCVPVTVKGRDLASATMSVKVTRRAAGIGGKIKNSSSNCQKEFEQLSKGMARRLCRLAASGGW